MTCAKGSKLVRGSKGLKWKPDRSDSRIHATLPCSENGFFFFGQITSVNVHTLCFLQHVTQEEICCDYH